MLIDYIPNGSTILLSGDSVTDCGRARPYGDPLWGLGNGYPAFLHNVITGTYPEKRIKLINAGISGETSRDVLKRWENDLDNVKPDFATLMIGANDVWRRYDAYLFPEKQVSDEEYEANIRNIIAIAQRKTKGFMLISPVFIDLNKNDAMRRDIDNLNAILKKLCNETNTIYCDVQSDIDKLLTKLHPTVFSPDRIHPTPTAHYAIARCILKQIGFAF